MRLSVEIVSKSINNYTQNYEYFWAWGLIRETVNLWKKPINYDLLNDIAKTMVDRYILVKDEEI
ncbi:hypothetical protein LCGC14_2531950 [marine sediment metagenome]|uniref:Uncharacterized protein n=1 Tax=marine sediment metagenome TaxID=412755 RepID=A0A0F9D4T9_9ZZZZ